MLVLLPLRGAGGLGGQVEHDPGDAGDLLDLVHHLQHHLNEKRGGTHNITIDYTEQNETMANKYP